MGRRLQSFHERGLALAKKPRVYGDFGACVWMDGKMQLDHCDTDLHTLFPETFTEGATFHGILGNPAGAVIVTVRDARIMYVYRCYPDGRALPMPLGIEALQGEIQVGRVKVNFDSVGGEVVYVDFVDELQRHWVGLCGFRMGEGHQKWEDLKDLSTGIR